MKRPVYCKSKYYPGKEKNEKNQCTAKANTTLEKRKVKKPVYCKNKYYPGKEKSEKNSVLQKQILP
ncbi:hypothetical protein [Butyrivibrio sp. JL13D10]|uniref:hypothetical protein n=1 Tax=Butyrivibrio sp. JL13D10 TaxID=3236815 RepID=UPI0038B42E68